MISWKIKETNTKPTLLVNKLQGEYFLYSKFDPKKEIDRWVSNLNLENEENSKIVIIGLGLGYHIDAIIKKYPNKNIIVWELNKDYYKWVMSFNEIKSLLLKNDNLEINCFSDYDTSYYKILKDITENNNEIIVIKQLLELVPESLRELKDILLNYEVNKRVIKNRKPELINNFHENAALLDSGINEWKTQYENRTMILISAGPSLTKQLPLLYEIRNGTNVVIGCVGTALSPLLLANIKPDFIMISDPKDNIAEQFRHIKTEDIPLLYLSTSNPFAVKSYKGPRFIVWQKGFDLAEIEAKKRSEPLIATGGSVATCLLDLMVQMKPKSLALVGADLAYTHNKSHAENTHGYKGRLNGAFLSVDNYYLNGRVKTPRNLLIYLKWFENYILRTNSQTILWNCTEGGAYINGWVHKSLHEYKANYL
ncbi:6-hydroxymethylpterin diphosphokinase MptE-like protein [Bacillus sp. JJ1122]|uniref:motility associated factor glycosyltransferase family protein n=1 Tax=Bacillus sp. JJ1122 TaxID=3122951 RepID=UPI002FFFE2FC